MKHNLAGSTNYNVITRHILNIYRDPPPLISIYDVPKAKLLESNNILAHFIALIHYTLTDKEIIYLFNTWRQNELEYCILPMSIIWLETLIPDFKKKHDGAENYVLDFLYKTMYNTQNITPLYNIIEHMELKTVDSSIIKQFQIPPFLMEKLIDMIDVNDVATHQLYIDKKIIMDNFSQFTEESLTLIIDHMASSDEKVLNKIIKHYPQLLSNIICANLATISHICTNKTAISKKIGFIFLRIMIYPMIKFYHCLDF